MAEIDREEVYDEIANRRLAVPVIGAVLLLLSAITFWFIDVGELAMASFEPPEGEDGAGSVSSIYGALLRDPAPRDMQARFAALATESDRFWFAGSEVYWGLQGKISESPLFGKGLDPAFKGAATTSRNMNTLRRLAAKFSS